MAAFFILLSKDLEIFVVCLRFRYRVFAGSTANKPGGCQITDASRLFNCLPIVALFPAFVYSRFKSRFPPGTLLWYVYCRVLTQC